MENTAIANREYHDQVDSIELAMVEAGTIEIGIRHYFTKGLYCREMFVPAGVMLTSKVHRTEHPYIISAGSVSVVKKDNNGENVLGEYMEAPYFGVTYKGTRRIIYAHTDTIWTTIHSTTVIPKSDSEEDIYTAALEVEAMIIEPYENKLLTKKELIWHL